MVNLLKLKQLDIMSLNLCSVVVEPVEPVRDLGVNFDSELSMRENKQKKSSICFFHLCRLRKIRLLVDLNSEQALVSAFILS